MGERVENVHELYDLSDCYAPSDDRRRPNLECREEVVAEILSNSRALGMVECFFAQK